MRLAEAPSHGMPGVVYDRASRGAQAGLYCIWRGNDRTRQRAGLNLDASCALLFRPPTRSRSGRELARLEEAALNATTVREQMLYEGWLVR